MTNKHKVKDYVEIGACFEQALEGVPIAASFETAIRIMKKMPDLVSRIPAWDDMIWLNVEEHLNSDPSMDADRAELFIHACTLLESERRTGAD
jgi:hypothetical protein